MRRQIMELTEAQKNHTIYKHFLSLNATKLLYPCEQLHAVLNCLQFAGLQFKVKEIPSC